ncbi:MAG: hypothetical protein HQM10_13330 [Candidatus Riflebacteria bacterium]|nr:hypothetical protein [Candidatus Riflebacteria bacterium]
MKICVSIPVHERPDVILDQIKNFRFYLPDCQIVLHKSQNFIHSPEFGKFDELEKLEGVSVNPVSLPTWSKWGSFVHVHNSNFEFAEKNLSFDYFCLHASNDLYVKPGALKYISSFDAGFQQDLIDSSSKWVLKDKIFSDPDLKKIMELSGAKDIFGSQVEGMFFKRGIFSKMVEIINKCYDFENVQLNYERAEVYYPTLARKLSPSTGLPCVFSSVAAALPEIVPEVVEKIRENLLTRESIISIYRNYQPGSPTSASESKKMIIKKLKTYAKAFIQLLKERKMPDIGFDVSKIPPFDNKYTVNNVYAVKRVDREINNPLRCKIRDLTKMDREKTL